jgi:hypothetical protein
MDTLLSAPLTAEVVVLFDADMAWVLHENKVDLTREQAQKYVAGLFEAVQHVAAAHQVVMRFGPAPEAPKAARVRAPRKKAGRA